MFNLFKSHVEKYHYLMKKNELYVSSFFIDTIGINKDNIFKYDSNYGYFFEIDNFKIFFYRNLENKYHYKTQKIDKQNIQKLINLFEINFNNSDFKHKCL